MSKAVCALALLVILSGSYSASQEQPFPVFEGPYAGQTPPGMVPQRFAPGFVSTAGYDVTPTFSPGLDEVFFGRRPTEDGSDDLSWQSVRRSIKPSGTPSIMNTKLCVIGLTLAMAVPCYGQSIRVYFDRAHGQLPVPPGMADVAAKLNLDIAVIEQPISAAGLEGSRLLYLRAPSKTFTDAEKSAIVAFVRKGGSLLLVLDEKKRQNLATTGVNDVIAPFGMRLTPDTPYVSNAGATAPAGEINRANRELPYDGGRAVEGGTPFAFQLDKNGKPAQPYGAWSKVQAGGRVVVLSEGMASLFLGSAAGLRLSPVTGSDSVYYGKDSAIFMAEVLAWLIKAS